MPTYTEKVIIDLPSDGEAIEIRKNGVKVGGIAFRTTALGNLQLLVNGTTVPALCIGGDRAPGDVQVSPDPVEKPIPHFTVRSSSMQGTYGDVWIDGTLNVIPAQVFLDANGSNTVPLDPRGAINLGRTRYPNANENLGLIRLWRKAQDGVVREEARMGLSQHGFLYFNNGGSDSPRIRFRFDEGSMKVLFLREQNNDYGEYSFDNSGALKYQAPSGNVTVVGNP